MLIRTLLPCYAFLTVLWAVSTKVPTMNALWLGTFTAVLALPTMLALWHEVTVRRLMELHQFQPDASLHRWGSRRALSILWRAALAVLLSAAVILQSVFFGWLEWILLSLAPPLYLLARRALNAKTAAQFTLPLYSQRWSSRAARWLLTLLLTAAWVIASTLVGETPMLPYAERIYQLQSVWAQAPSGSVKWALDAGAWGQASIEALGRFADRLEWRGLLALVIAPVSVFSFLLLSLSGLSLPLTEVRRTLGERMTADRSPPPVGAARAALWTAMTSIVVIILFQSLGALDHRMRVAESPFAIRSLPECERIGGKVYAVNTASALKAFMDQTQVQFASHQAAACSKLSEIEALAARGVDQYLDWYFSLGAEWSRFAMLLTGDIDLLLQAMFNEKVMSNPEIVQRLPAVHAAYEAQWALLVGARSGALDILDRNRLVLDERSCKVVKEGTLTPWTRQWEGSKARLTGGAGAGLIAGSLAAKVTAKAMGKTTMKSAVAVLTKAVAKKGIGMAGTAMAGAAVGSVVPGLGTALGAAFGAGVGLMVGVGIDMAALAAEEKLSREDMRKDLLSAVSESLQSYRETFDCKIVGKVGGLRPI